MQEAAEKLAITIGENIMAHNVCARRNPMSIAAAVIYLACNLEDQKKTQTEICKVTGLTEVTLRKVYKEFRVE
jgi:transcription initiation factor TFIIB